MVKTKTKQGPTNKSESITQNPFKVAHGEAIGCSPNAFISLPLTHVQFCHVTMATTAPAPATLKDGLNADFIFHSLCNDRKNKL